MTELEEMIDTDVYEWLTKLDTRINYIETLTNDITPSFVSDIIPRLNALEKFQTNDLQIMLDRLGHRLNTLEQLPIQDIAFVTSDIDNKIDNQNAAIGALANALRSHLEDVAPTQPEQELELEFAQPPQQPMSIQVTKGDIETVAQVAQSMGDVLMIWRALKAKADLADEDRLYLLQVACKMADEQVTGGLQIRAGMRNVVV